mmetsp:Transcript_14398/g.43236  ORF Transcript_14398/g.43236 Transcript_14398/m.43236 type:complete len:242 (-) Transcript_14398:342-1067(-)
MWAIAREEGSLSLWKGIEPALLRQISYTSVSFVIYAPIRDLIAGQGVRKEDIPFHLRVLSGGCAGGISIILMNPTDVIKTRMQASRGQPSIVSLLKDVYRSEGALGFWRGWSPNVARCFVGNAAEIGCYDGFKNHIIKNNVFSDGPMAHFAASGGAGIVSAVFSTPVDVVKTRIMNQAGTADQSLPKYKGVVDAFLRISRHEGFGAFYKGFWPLAFRKVLWTVVYFMAYERALKAITGGYS